MLISCYIEENVPYFTLGDYEDELFTYKNGIFYSEHNVVKPEVITSTYIHRFWFEEESRYILPLFFPNLVYLDIRGYINDSILLFLKKHTTIKTLFINYSDYNDSAKNGKKCKYIRENVIDVLNTLRLDKLEFISCEFDNSFYKLNKRIKNLSFDSTYFTRDIIRNPNTIYDILVFPIRIPQNVNNLIYDFSQDNIEVVEKEEWIWYK